MNRFGPALPRIRLRDGMRGAAGAGIGLFVANLVLWALSGAATPLTDPLLIAPFGASAFLIFGAHSSPLAQPWPAVLGNGLSALSAVAVLQLGLPPMIALSLAVALAMGVMAAARALHPPGGAVAIATVLLAHTGHVPGLIFVLHPVLDGTVALVLIGLIWHRLTGHLYPHILR